MELFIILLHCCQMVKADDRKYYFRQIDKAFFISPIVDMEKVILDMMRWADITEEKLREKQLITINEQIQNIAQKKDTLCRRMYN